MSLFSPTISNLLVSPFTRKFLTEGFFDDFTEPSREQEVFSTHHQVLTIHQRLHFFGRVVENGGKFKTFCEQEIAELL